MVLPRFFMFFFFFMFSTSFRGLASYRFELNATAQLTSNETLRARAADGIVSESEAVLAAEDASLARK